MLLDLKKSTALCKLITRTCFRWTGNLSNNRIHIFEQAGLKEGYAGVGLYSKEKAISVKYGLGKQEYDSEGRVITAEYEKFYVVAVCEYLNHFYITGKVM